MKTAGTVRLEMIDLKAWDRQDRAFRAYVKAEAKRAGNYPPMRDKLLTEICCHYELESDEFSSATQKAESLLLGLHHLNL